RKWKQVEASDVFVTNKPELESVLILGQPWFQENTMKVDFPNKTLTLLDETSYEIKSFGTTVVLLFYGVALSFLQKKIIREVGMVIRYLELLPGN
ncbi:5042_t:CDS:2, partial [Dentiscutata heterogama]